VCEGKTIVNYITQSDAVEFIFKNKMLGPAASKTVESLNVATKNVITVKQTEMVIEAFKKMVLEKVSGVGVVDDDNKLVGCISAHDIRAVTSSGELLEHLYQPYDQYRAIMNTLKVPTKAHVIKASASTTLQGVLEIILKEKVHRVFLADSTDHPTGIISLADILRCVSTS